MSGICKREGHGKFEHKKCPKCCTHGEQVNLQSGVRCNLCGMFLSWIKAAQLMDVERELSAANKALEDMEATSERWRRHWQETAQKLALADKQLKIVRLQRDNWISRATQMAMLISVPHESVPAESAETSEESIADGRVKEISEK